MIFQILNCILKTKRMQPTIKNVLVDTYLDTNKTIKEQFNLLRISDNKRYPARFKIEGKDYILKIYKD